MQSIREAVSGDNYTEAFTLYLNLLHQNPNVKNDHQDIFVEVLYNHSLKLEEEKAPESIIKAYEKALAVYPESVFLYNNLAGHLMRLGMFVEAKTYLDVACTLNPHHLQSRNNLDHAKATLVPPWHFRMLNDKVRNNSYFTVIRKNIEEGFDRVVDVGSGCGLLSLFASSTNSTKKVSAIEESEILCKVASSIFATNDISNVNLIQKPSNQVSVKEVDANLLVTEIFDAALFGECMLETLMYALHFVMNNDKWKIVPLKATLYVTGVSSSDIIKKHRLLHDISDVKLDGVCLTQENVEPYEGENLQHLDVDYVTETKEIATINFGDYETLMNLFVSGHLRTFLPIKIVKDTFVDAFAVWFDLYLDETTKISTNPFDGNVKCWEQAIFYLDHKIPVKKNTELNLSVRVIDNCLKIDVLNNNEKCGGCFKASQDVILFLNDPKIVKRMKILAQKMMGHKNVTVCDLSSFPLFGILMAIGGAHLKIPAKNDTDKKFLEHILNENKIEAQIITDGSILKNTINEGSDFCLFQPILRSGVLDENFFTNVYEDSSNTIFLPNVIKPIFQVIECNYIDYYNKVDDGNVCGFKVAEIFNEYTVSQHLLFKKNIPYKPLTEMVVGENLACDKDFSGHFSVTGENCGRANAILYWFVCDYLGHVKVDTSECDYYSRACFILKKPVLVCKNKRVTFEVMFSKGLLGLKNIITDDNCSHTH